MFTGEPLPAKPMTINAYLGAPPIAAALAAGADIVVTGRCVDSAVDARPADARVRLVRQPTTTCLSAGTLAGHIVECGAAVHWRQLHRLGDRAGLERHGLPDRRVPRRRHGVITKPAGSGGLVTPATVSEQILYEIGDPGAYIMPDVVCDWRQVPARAGRRATACASSGAKGSEPPSTYKVTATHADGYRCTTTAMFSGIDAAAKARRAGEALVARTERKLAKAGHPPLTEHSIEVIGAGDTYGPDHRDDAATEAVVKVAARHADRAALELFAGEYAPMALVAQGMTGFFGGRPRVAPSIERPPPAGREGLGRRRRRARRRDHAGRHRPRRARRRDRHARAGGRRGGGRVQRRRLDRRAAPAGVRALGRQGRQRQHRGDRAAAGVRRRDRRAGDRRAGRALLLPLRHGRRAPLGAARPVGAELRPRGRAGRQGRHLDPALRPAGQVVRCDAARAADRACRPTGTTRA